MCVWRYDTQARHVWSPHEYLVTSMTWGGVPGDNTVYTGSADGLVKSVDLDTHDSTPLLMLNPLGWQGKPKEWRMVYALGGGDGCLWAGDDVGNVHVLDPRGGAGGIHGRTVHQFNAHGKGNKVQFVQCNPRAPWLVATCGNDKAARIWDARMLRAPQRAQASWPSADGEIWSGHAGSASGAADASSAVVTLLHPRAVNSAVWSPCTGRKLMTTCLDNRIRIWDNPLVLHGVQAAPPVHPSEGAPSNTANEAGAADSDDEDFENSAVQQRPVAPPAAPPASGADLELGDAFPPPSATLIHSHDFGRYLSPFRAQWDPKDTAERLVVCGRYISEDFNGVKLHPIDLLDAARGGAGGPSSTVVTQLVDPLVPTICPVNAVSPHEHAVATGSSMSMFVWKPVPGHLLPPKRKHGDGPPVAGSGASAQPDDVDSHGSGHTPWWELPEYTLALEALEAKGGKGGKKGGGKKAGKKAGTKRSRQGGDVARSFTAAAAAAAGVPASASVPAHPLAPAAASLDVLVCSGREGDVQPYNIVSALNKNKKAAAAKARAAKRDTAEAKAVKAKAAQDASDRADALFQARVKSTFAGLPGGGGSTEASEETTTVPPGAHGSSPTPVLTGSSGQSPVVDLTSPDASPGGHTPAPASPAPQRCRRGRAAASPLQKVSPYFSTPPSAAPPGGSQETGALAPQPTNRTTPKKQKSAHATGASRRKSTGRGAAAASAAVATEAASPLEAFAYSGPSGSLRSARRLDASTLQQMQQAQHTGSAPPASVVQSSAGTQGPDLPACDSSDDSDFVDALPAALLVAKASPAGRR